MQRRAFTLIELIVVLIIIGILAAILFPVMFDGHKRGRARRAQCQSNLKQIGLAFHMYAQDFEERFPAATLNPMTLTSLDAKYRYGWADTLTLYTKSIEVFQCPAEPSPHTPVRPPWERGYTDYFLNTQMSAMQISKISDVASVVLSGEGNDGKDQADARYAFPSVPLTFGQTDTSPARRHMDGANYGFADGHVKWLSFERRPSIPSPGVSGFRFGK